MTQKSRRTAWQQIAGSQGILAPIAGITFIEAAIATYPQFSWVNNALSDLGVVPGITSTLFNFGLCLTGLLFFTFSVGLFTFLSDHTTGKVSSAIFALTSLSLEGIGLFPENARPFHLIFSVAFFTLLPLALLMATAYFAVKRKKRMLFFTLSVAIVAALPWVLLSLVPYVQGVAIPEIVSAIAGAFWTITIGYKMYKEANAWEKQTHVSP